MFSRHRQLGLHLTSNHLRLVEFDGRKKVGIFGRADFEIPLEQIRKLNKFELLNAAFKTVFEEAKPHRPHSRNAILTIGDEEIFTKILEMPIVTKKEAASMAIHEIEPDLPVKADELYTDAIILDQHQDTKRMTVMVYAVPKVLVDSALKAAAGIGVTILAVEAASISLTRLYGNQFQRFVIIDIGTEHSLISIIDQGQIRVTTSITFNNEDWVNILKKKSTKLSKEEAVATYGPVVSELANKIQSAVQYYTTRSKNAGKIEQVLLSGTGTTAPHLASMLTSLLNIPTKIGNPQIIIGEEGNAGFLAAAGAAIRTKDADD